MALKAAAGGGRASERNTRSSSTRSPIPTAIAPWCESRSRCYRCSNAPSTAARRLGPPETLVGRPFRDSPHVRQTIPQRLEYLRDNKIAARHQTRRRALQRAENLRQAGPSAAAWTGTPSARTCWAGARSCCGGRIGNDIRKAGSDRASDGRGRTLRRHAVEPRVLSAQARQPLSGLAGPGPHLQQERGTTTIRTGPSHPTETDVGAIAAAAATS